MGIKIGGMERITVSSAEATVLRCLDKSTAPLYGLEMVRQAQGGLARGTVYVTLGRMEDKGWVTSEAEPRKPNVSGIPRRLYSVTRQGASVYRQWLKLQTVGAR